MDPAAAGPREYGYVTGLGPDNDPLGDRLRVRFATVARDVLDFTVQGEALLNGDRYPVVRYDTAHGYAHRHILDWYGEDVRVTRLPEHLSYKQALNVAIDDVTERWESYRREFVRRRPR